MPKLIAISPFATSESSGHPIVDDQFYFAYLLNRGLDFLYYTSRDSANLILKQHPEAHRFLAIVEPYRPNGLGHLRFASKLVIHPDARVIFFLYTERLVLTWYLLNIFKPFRLFLVSSNNISAFRVRLHPFYLKLFFSVIRPKLEKLILDSTFQVKLVRAISEKVAKLCFVRKNHLMCPKYISIENEDTNRIFIAYFGPVTSEKPLSIFIDLIKADEHQQFFYSIYNVSKDLVMHHLNMEQLPINVKVVPAWHSYETYLKNYMASDVVMLTHTKDYEGKLSGNLCDSIALGVPFISLPIEPIISMHDTYGTLGYLFRFDERGWEIELLKSIDRKTLNQMKKNITLMQDKYSVKNVWQTLDKAFGLGEQ
jgi:hypothetical protein